MPELPEVETMRRGILPIIGQRIEAVQFARCAFKPIRIHPGKPSFRRRLTNQAIVDIDRLGKRVLVRLESDDTIVMEPRMTGLVLLADPPDREHLRVGFRLSHGKHDELWFWDRRGLGSVKLFTPNEMERELGAHKLGPDALNATADDFRERYGKSRRHVKVALLDQKAVAGIGNLYASEILHHAQVHPEKQCDRITRAQWTAIQRATQLILNEAIKYEGSTLNDGTYRNALNETGGYQNHHKVYNRKDADCPRCGAKIVRRVHAQRSTFFCPACQKK